MEKVIKKLQRIREKNVYLFLLSSILAFCFFSYINDFTYNVLPVANITISSYGVDSSIELNNNYITLLENEGTEKFYSLKKIFEDNKDRKENKEGLSYIKKGEAGYGLNAVHINSPKNKITIPIKKLPNTKIIFYKIGKSNEILISSLKSSQIIDLSEVKEGDIFSYYPFNNSKLFFVYSFVIYIFLITLIFIIVKTFIFWIKRIEYPKFFMSYNPKKMVFIIYFFITSYISYLFLMNLLPSSLFTENKDFFGDQGYYWHIGNLIKNFNISGLIKDSLTFRGYVASILPNITDIRRFDKD